MRSEYRPDVDGLRAVAILAVLTFHAFPQALPGGFVGVDVFFVISGFLITRIIVGEIQGGTFTFRKFYSRRIRRIFPALAVVLTFTVLVGWLVLLPYDFALLGGHVASGAAFGSNLLLWKETGDYFDVNASVKPLLHLWSLGVEEQYYIMWPLLLVILRKRISWVPVLILLVAVGSFAFNVPTAPHHPRSAFYLPQSRFWELMIGSALAYAALNHANVLAWLRPARGAIAAAGVVLLAIGFGVIHEHRVFPGAWALLPTIGTGLLILAGPDTWLNRNVLAARAMVFIGLISYPLYLWHWPLLAYARIYLEEDPSTGAKVLLLGLSVLLAWLTYVLLEQRVRHAGTARAPYRTVWALCGSLAVLAICGLLTLTERVDARSSGAPFVAEISEALHDWQAVDNRSVPGESRATVLFFGDSHMQQFLPRVDYVAQRPIAPPRRTVVIRTRGGCAPIPGIERRGYDCHGYVEDTYRMAQRPEIDTIVIAASWHGFLSRTDYFRAGDEDSGSPLALAAAEQQWIWDGFEAQLRGLVKRGKRVAIILSTPRGRAFDPRNMISRSGLAFEVHITRRLEASAVARETAAVDARLREIARRVGAEIVVAFDWVCGREWCPTIDAQGNPYFMDDSHLRASFVREHLSGLDEFIYVTPADGGGQLTHAN
jgi:peptidoglycan/LPS O-acetylase OafA/YrhL